jgi:hypothetical protein
MNAAGHGPLLRLWGITTNQLPPESSTSEELLPFLLSMLQEAVPFIDSAAPKSGDASHPSAKAWKSKGTKSSAGSSAKVEIAERVISASELEALAAERRGAGGGGGGGASSHETWAVRKSVHADAAEKGTASWAEFVDCFKERHAETEDAFTPAVVGAREAMHWECGTVEVHEAGVNWGRFTLKVQEMRHKIGAPLNDRVFPVLQMSCAAVAETHDGSDRAAATATAQPEFLVVSLPLTDFQSSEHAGLVKDKGVVVGSYASVERIRKLPDGNIEWVMAVASDAKGVLPMRVQVLAIPGQIAKDVPLFFSWIAKERAKREPEASAA